MIPLLIEGLISGDMFMEQNKGNSLLSQIDLENLPRHIAIIMDGNGRWASKRLLPGILAIGRGKRVVEIVKLLPSLVLFLTLYAFSTENWKRPEKRLMVYESLVIYIRNELNRLIKNNVV